MVEQPPVRASQLDWHVAAPLQVRAQPVPQLVMVQLVAVPEQVRLQPPPGQSRLQSPELQVIWQLPPGQVLLQVSLPVQVNWQLPSVSDSQASSQVESLQVHCFPSMQLSPQAPEKNRPIPSADKTAIRRTKEIEADKGTSS